MEELIRRIREATGISETQAIRAIETVRDFAKERFPIFAGPIDRLFERYAPRTEDDFLD